MAATAILEDVLGTFPDHPVPYAGDVVHLVYPPLEGSVGVTVSTDEKGVAKFTVAAGEEEARRSIIAARSALTRMAGFDPTTPEGVRRANAYMGTAQFEQQVGLLVKQRLLALAEMRTGILPFLSPRYMRGEMPTLTEDYHFQAIMQLRPRGILNSYEPLELEFPERQEGQSDNDYAAVLNDACAVALADRLLHEPEESFVNQLREEMANQFAANVERQGTKWEDFMASPDFDMAEFKDRMTENARESLRRGMALDAMADHLHIEIDVDDIMACMGTVAKGAERSAADAMLDSGKLPQVWEVARRLKTSDKLAELAINTRK